MRGVFGAGVVTYLQETDAYASIEAVYGSSAGSLAGAYFLSKQTRIGSSIYYEDLTHTFISTLNFWRGIRDRIVKRFLYRNQKLHDAMDFDYLFRVIQKDKILDVPSIFKTGIPLYIKILDVRTKAITYHKATEENLTRLLRASVETIPYTHSPVRIDDVLGVDAGIVDQIGFRELRQKYPHHPIIVVMSSDSHFKVSSLIKNYIEGVFAWMMYGTGWFSLFAHTTTRLREDFTLMEQDGNTLMLHAPKHSPTISRTSESKRLKVTYQMGIDAGKEISAFLKSRKAPADISVETGREN